MILEWVKRNLEGSDNSKAIEGVKRLQGIDEGWRYRVGSYRILASIKEDEILIEIVRVGHRQGVYENLTKI